MLPLPEVTKNLLIINVLVFLAQISIPQATQYLALYPPAHSPFFQPYQFVTYMFAHSPHNAAHIFFNMFSLYTFGRDLEYSLGAKRFLALYLLAGLGAGFLHTLVGYFEISQLIEKTPGLLQALQEKPAFMVVGASGAVFGLLAAFGMLYPNRQLMLLFPPIPMPAKYFVLIFGGLELYLGAAGAQTGVAHFAHLGGAIIGGLLIWIWRIRGARF